jgi:hypothetical protein
VNAFDKKQYTAALHETFAEVAKMGDGENRPKIKVNADSIDFGKIW